MERQIQQTDTPFNLLLCLYERGQLEMRIRNLAPSAYTAAIVVAESESDRNALEKLPNTLPLILFNGTSRNFCSVSCQTEDPSDRPRKSSPQKTITTSSFYPEFSLIVPKMIR